MVISAIIFCALVLCTFVKAQTVVQDDWLFPSQPDLFQTLPIGLTVSISWDGHLYTWFASYCPAAIITDVDLWITDFNDHIFSHQIGTGIDVSHAGTFQWTVELPSTELQVTNEWVFRFIAANQTGTTNTGQISSPGFYVSNDTTTSTTTSSSATSSTPTFTSTASAAATTSAHSGNATGGTSAPSSSSTATAAAPSSLSTGAKVGIAIGAVAGACVLVGVGWFLARKRHQRNKTSAGEIVESSRQPSQTNSIGTRPAPNEKKFSGYNGPEIPSHRAELDPGSPGQTYHEQLVEMDGEGRATGQR